MELPFIYQKVFPKDSLNSVTGVVIILLFKVHTIKGTEPHFPRMTNYLIKMLVKDFFLSPPDFPSFSFFFFFFGLVTEILIGCIQSMNHLCMYVSPICT